MPRLTDEQRDRASRHPACLIPQAVARTLAGGDDTLHDDILSVASWVYVRHAAHFDPAANHRGEDGFGAWIYHRVRREVPYRLARARGRGRVKALPLPDDLAAPPPPRDDGGMPPLDALDADERAAVTLRHAEGLPPGVVASRLWPGLSSGARRARLLKVLASAAGKLKAEANKGEGGAS